MAIIFRKTGQVTNGFLLIGHLRKHEAAYEFQPWDMREGYIVRIEKTRAAMRERLTLDSKTIENSRT